MQYDLPLQLCWVYSVKSCHTRYRAPVASSAYEASLESCGGGTPSYILYLQHNPPCNSELYN